MDALARQSIPDEGVSETIGRHVLVLIARGEPVTREALISSLEQAAGAPPSACGAFDSERTLAEAAAAKLREVDLIPLLRNLLRNPGEATR